MAISEIGIHSGIKDKETEKTGPYKVLVIEDEEPIAEMMRLTFEEEAFRGMEFRFAEGMETAREIIETGWNPDAVIADYRVSDGLGVDIVPFVMDYQKDRGLSNGHPPFLFVFSACRRDEIYEHCRLSEIEINCFVGKPGDDIYADLGKPLIEQQKLKQNKKQ
ncbi:hypothetical protein M1307_01020 [Patescibacteria group bacterium]|nr:hypothetical protein [Patescibacteria group bacterium]